MVPNIFVHILKLRNYPRKQVKTLNIMFYKSYYTFIELFKMSSQVGIGRIFPSWFIYINFAHFFESYRVSSQKRDDVRFGVKSLGKKKDAESSLLETANHILRHFLILCIFTGNQLHWPINDFVMGQWQVYSHQQTDCLGLNTMNKSLSLFIPQFPHL